MSPISLLIRWLRLLSALFALSCLAMPVVLWSAEQAPAFDRSDFGRNPIPVWSPLTEFERETIERFPAALNGDADALLALYLLASGDVRTGEEFRSLRRQIEQGMAPMEEELSAAGSAREKGERLHRAMFEHFLAPASDRDPLAGYEADQSQLSRLLETGVYNCISSSLLYTALAHRLGLTAQGVLLPSHAFVQLELPGGETVEVETTSLGGFGLEHDRSFYEGSDLEWFSERDLEPPDHADYLDRNILSAAALGLENMWNQHAQRGRLDYRARMRLAEIKGHLQPDDHLAQKNRLLFYTREFNHLDAREDKVALARLFERITPYLQSMERLADTGPASEDREFGTLLAWLQSARANTYIDGGQPERGLSLARRHLEELDAGSMDVERIRHNLYLSLVRYVQGRMAAGDFLQAREAFDGLESRCGEHSVCAEGLTEFYAGWAQRHWQAGDWPRTIEIYTEFLGLDVRGANIEVMRENMESAYLNWANQRWIDEDREGAVERLRECGRRLPEASRCQSRLEEMQAAIY